MMLTKKNMFGGDGGEQVGINYQWKGSYTKEQMSDEVLRVEHFLDANRKKFHVKQIYSYFSEQGDANTVVTFDSKDAKVTKPLSDAISKALPKSARATVTLGNDGDNGGPRQNVQVQLVGDSTQTLRTWPTTSSRSCRAARNCATCASMPATGTASSRSTSIASAPRRSVSAPRTCRSSSALRCVARRCANSAAARPKCRCGCASPAPSNFGMEDIAPFTVRAPDGRTVPLLSMVDVSVLPAANADQAHQPPDRADDQGQPRPTRSRCPKRARRWRRR